MKLYLKFFTLILIAFIAKANAIEDSNAPSELFLKGNELYMSGDFNSAITTFNSILDKGFESSEVYFNTGNAYFKLKDYPNAILYFEKALKLNPSDEDVLYNLKLVNQKITDKIEPLPELIFTKIWRSIMLSKTADNWASSTLILLFISVGLFILYYISPTSVIKKISFYTFCIGIVLSFFAFLFGWQNSNYMLNSNSAIVFEPSLTVRSAPEATSTKLFVIHEGTKVFIKENIGEWTKISLSNGNIGWVSTKTLQKI